MSSVETNVNRIEVDNLDEWDIAPGSASVVTPENKTPNIFSSKDPGLSDILDTDLNPGATDEEETPDPEKDKVTQTGQEVLNELDQLTQEDTEQEDEPVKTGRPKTDKSGLIGFLKSKIESEEMFAFDDYDEEKQTLDEYLNSLPAKDVEELLQFNIENIRKEAESKAPQELFSALPEELQFAAQYAMNGGQDMKGLFKALAQVEEVRSMDPANESDQELIVKSYLKASGFGTDEDIDEEISTWKDLGQLEQKAKKFKPKLDQMQEAMVQNQLEEQEQRKQQQIAAAQKYVDNVFNALKEGEINGLKLQKKVQQDLYTGLTTPQYPSASGRPTNLLGHLLDKYQYGEQANYSLIAEATWLLQDPEGYRKALIQQGANQATEKVVRQLKTEQSKKTSSGLNIEDPEDNKFKSKKLNKPTRNIFDKG